MMPFIQLPHAVFEFIAENSDKNLNNFVIAVLHLKSR